MMFAIVSGHGIVNVKCHHADGTESKWLTRNEPVNKNQPNGYFPPKSREDTWNNAVKGRIRHIEVREKGGDGIVDCRYQV